MIAKRLISTETLGCPFCGKQPRVELGKKGHCQLHGEPYQSVVVRCVENYCPAKPQIAAGDIYNGGETKARREAIAKWNMRDGMIDRTQTTTPEALEAETADV